MIWILLLSPFSWQGHRRAETLPSLSMVTQPYMGELAFKDRPVRPRSLSRERFLSSYRKGATRAKGICVFTSWLYEISNFVRTKRRGKCNEFLYTHHPVSAIINWLWVIFKPTWEDLSSSKRLCLHQGVNQPGRICDLFGKLTLHNTSSHYKV